MFQDVALEYMACEQPLDMIGDKDVLVIRIGKTSLNEKLLQMIRRSGNKMSLLDFDTEHGTLENIARQLHMQDDHECLVIMTRDDGLAKRIKETYMFGRSCVIYPY